jgi:hypothetical protein
MSAFRVLGVGKMLIRLGYDIELQLSIDMTVIAVLSIHPSRTKDLKGPDEVQISPPSTAEIYKDCFGNICTSIAAQQGPLRLFGSTLIDDSGNPDPVDTDARQVPISDLPKETLQFLLASR